jgi:hypothetical protein
MSRSARFAVVVICVLFVSCVAPALLRLPLVVLFGWAFAAFRLAKGISVSASSLSEFLLASFILGAGLHCFCLWLSRARRTGVVASQSWRWQQSVAIFGGVWLLLFAVMSLLGIAHQVGWIIVSHEPIMISRSQHFRTKIDLNNVAKDILTAAGANDWNAIKTREAFYTLEKPLLSTRGLQWEKFNLIFLDSSNDHFSAVAAIPVDAVTREEYGIAIIERGREPLLVRTNLETFLRERGVEIP